MRRLAYFSRVQSSTYAWAGVVTIGGRAGGDSGEEKGGRHAKPVTSMCGGVGNLKASDRDSGPQ